jgi:hypothetical protein
MQFPPEQKNAAVPAVRGTIASRGVLSLTKPQEVHLNIAEAFWLLCIPEESIRTLDLLRELIKPNEASSSLINDRNIISRNAAICQQR